MPGIAERRLQLGKALQSRIGARMLVAIDDGRRPLAARYLDGDDLLGEIAALLRRLRPHLAAPGEGVLVRPRDLELLGDVLRRLRHGIDAVLRLHQRIDETPADGGVVHLDRTLERLGALRQHERRARHRLDAAGDDEVLLARTDRARGRADGVEPGTAEPVDGGAGDAVRQAGQQGRHPGDVAVVLAGLVGAAERHVVQARPVGPRMARHQGADRNRRQIVGAHLGERPSEAADRRPHRVADEGVAQPVAHAAAP